MSRRGAIGGLAVILIVVIAGWAIVAESGPSAVVGLPSMPSREEAPPDLVLELGPDTLITTLPYEGELENGIVRGRVIDASGRPCSRITLKALPATMEKGVWDLFMQRPLGIEQLAASQADGSFTMTLAAESPHRCHLGVRREDGQWFVVAGIPDSVKDFTIRFSEPALSAASTITASARRQSLVCYRLLPTPRTLSAPPPAGASPAVRKPSPIQNVSLPGLGR